MQNSLSVVQKVIPQHNSFVMGLVPGCINQSDDPMPSQAAELFDLGLMLLQFPPVPLLKFIPADRVVPKPLPKRGAWRNVLYPMIDGRIGLSDPARP